MTGFDIWLTEIITGLIRPVEEARDLLDSPTTSKYKTLYERFHGQLPGELSELETVVDIRHEIVHHFPRLNRSLIPEWFPELQRRGLLLTSPSGNDDFDFTQKLGSYSLSYWVFQVVESSAGRLVCGSKIGTAKLHTSDLYNFALYKAVCHPEQLQLFDAQDSLDREIRQ